MRDATNIKLEPHNNGTYSILIEDTNKCLVYKNNKLTIDDYIEDNFINEFYFENIKYKKFIETTATYSKDGKLLESTTDSLDKVTKYDIDPITGLTKSVTDATGNITTYLYNDKEQLTKVTKNNNSIEYKYTKDNLSSIVLGNKTYNFTYDNFLNNKEVKINNTTLVTNEYEKNNGNLINIKYGNNTNINYTYDYLDRIDTITKNTNKYKYTYDNLGRLSKIKSNEYTYNYYYDLASRLVKYDTISDKETNSICYTYDKNNNIVKKKYNDNIVEYTYNKDDIITKVTLDNNDLNYEYDALNRLESKNINDNLRVEYTYYNLGNKTSYLLHTLKIDTDTYEYIYDDLYNIIKINLNNKVLNEYKYDINNQLILDNNYSNNITYKYTYDNYGNILSKSTYKLNTTTLINTDTYTYGNPNYKDQLTKFNNDTITYDNIGNPLKIGNTTYNWSNGRELQSINNPNLNVSYKYDRNGIRTKKILNNEEISYCLENSSIVIEKHNDYMLYFLRDDSNNLLGFTYQGDTYYYKKNAFDDIIGIYDSNYKEVCSYNYDSYGNILSIKDSTGKDITDTSNVAIINPFRYRSYYYDTETNLYYLNSRYYSPKMGRFINCDGLIETSDLCCSYNLYAYCVNSPIGKRDEAGALAGVMSSLGGLGIIIGGLLGILISQSPAGRKAAKDAAYCISNEISEVLSHTKVVGKENAERRKQAKDDNVYSVYLLYNKTEGRVDYVGRTNNLYLRMQQHAHNPARSHLIMRVNPADEFLPYDVARWREQQYIETFQTLKRDWRGCNKINGINKSNKEKYEYYRSQAIKYDGETYVGGY